MKRIGTRCLPVLASAIVIVAASIRPASAQEPLRSTQSLEEATAIAAELLRRQEDPVRTAILGAERARATLEALPIAPGAPGFDEIAGQYEAAVALYAESLQALGHTPHVSTLGPLSAAVDHRDDRVRLASLAALREGAASDSSAPVLREARALVTSDPSPQIRRQAFEVYCRWGDQDDVLSLSMSLGRAPGPVQDLAVREWIRIEKERLSEGDQW